jgi:hypothetical protein
MSIYHDHRKSSMTKEFRADGQAMRIQGENEHGRVEPIQDKSRRPEEWLNDFYDMYGYAAHEFLAGTLDYMERREREIGNIASGRQQSAEGLYGAAGQFESADVDGGNQVRRHSPGV